MRRGLDVQQCDASRRRGRSEVEDLERRFFFSARKSQNTESPIAAAVADVAAPRACGFVVRRGEERACAVKRHVLMKCLSSNVRISSLCTGRRWPSRRVGDMVHLAQCMLLYCCY